MSCRRDADLINRKLAEDVEMLEKSPAATRAIISASLTSSRTLPSGDFIRRTRDPDLVSPSRVERTPTMKGSKRLMLGKWIED